MMGAAICSKDKNHAQLEPKQMNYKLDQNNNEELEICIDKTCQIQSKLINTVSGFKQHSGHKTHSIKEIQALVTNNKEFKVLESLGSILDGMLEQINNLQLVIKNLMMDFQKKLQEKVKEQINRYKGVQQLLIALNGNSLNDLPSLQKEFVNIESLAQYTKEINQVQEKSSAIITSIKGQIETVFQNINLDVSPKIPPIGQCVIPKFSSIMKASTISVTQNGQKANQGQNSTSVNSISSNEFAFIEPPLDQMGIRRFGVKIMNNYDFIQIGLCRMNKIKENKQLFIQIFDINFSYGCDYNSNYSNCNCYIIRHNGVLLLHGQPYISGINFSYKVGDIVIQQYDPKKKIVKFKNQSTNQAYQYKIAATETEQLVACVGLYYQNDEVEIYTEGIQDWKF